MVAYQVEKGDPIGAGFYLLWDNSNIFSPTGIAGGRADESTETCSAGGCEGGTRGTSGAMNGTERPCETSGASEEGKPYTGGKRR